MRKILSAAAVTGLAATCLLALDPAGPAAAETTPVLSADFEDGGTAGWGPRGPAQVATTADAAHGGTRSLLTTGRTAAWNGPSRNLLGVLLPGASYAVEAQVRMAAGQPAAELNLTMQRTPDGGSTAFERVAGAGTVTDGAWVAARGEYTFSGDVSELQLYLESPDATAAYLMDDFSIVMIAPPPDGPPDTTGMSSDFESGTRQGWAPRISSETLAVTDADAHSGTHSLLTTDRTQTYAGPALNVLGRVGKGKTYSLTAWVRLAPGEAPAQLRLSIERRLAGTPSYETLVGNTTVTADGWVRMTNNYTLAYDVDFLSVYVESAAGTPSFYLDDFALTYLPPVPIQTGIPSLKDLFGFKVGTAISRGDTVGVRSELVLKHFDSATPGNALKWDSTEPTEGQFAWTEPDAEVDFAVSNGLAVRGHTLVWHNQTPAWVFQRADGTPLTSSTEDKALLLTRLENHIRAVAGRYADRVYAWDVVNEVIDETQPDGLRRSRWYEITGDEYIRTAFRVAREVVGDRGKLYINDYNTELPAKRKALFALVQRLRADGVPIDGVGHQAHIAVTRPPVSYLEDTITRFAALGVDQQITELDMTVYPNDTDSYPSIPPELLTEQGYRYRDVFDVLRRQAARLSSVTLWGASDVDTWLKTFPINRLDAPLLFDEQLQAKPAYWGAVGSAGCRR